MEYPSILHRWFEEVWNQGNESAIDAIMAPNGVTHNLDETGGDTHGPAEFKVFWRRMREAFPDIRVTIQDFITQGDKIAARWTASMTHHGDNMGLHATGRRIEITGMSFGHVADGKLREGWNNWDVYAMYQQLGLIPKFRPPEP